MWDSFLSAMQFLTRIKVPSPPYDPVKLGRSTPFFPLVGLVIGVILFLAAEAGLYLLTPVITAALLLVLNTAVTGGLHLDGFMDTMDGLLSGRTPERKLEIMKDSRVGAFGVITLVCLFILRFSFVYELLQTGRTGWIIAVPVFARWTMVYAIGRFPYLRKEGLGNPFKEHSGSRELMAATVLMAAFVFIFLGFRAAGLVAVWLILRFFLLRAARELGGLTGDLYGAAAELSETLALMVTYLGYTLK